MKATTMRTKKSTDATNDLATRAKLEERAWRAKTPAASALPNPEAQPTRAERRAKLEYQAAHGDEAANRKIDAARKRERDEAAEREKLRNRRQRPHKHRPSWLADLPVVTEASERDGKPYKIDRIARSGETPTRIAVGVRSKVDPPPLFAPVTPELARQAQALRKLFDVKASARGIGQLPSSDGCDFMAVEAVEAVRAAVAAVSAAWVTILIDALLRAVEERRERTLNPGTAIAEWKILEPDPNRPEDIARHVRAQTERQFHGLVAVPDYVTDKVVAWALERVTLGHGAGRGKKVKLTAASLGSLLLSPANLARAMGQAGGA